MTVGDCIRALHSRKKFFRKRQFMNKILNVLFADFLTDIYQFKIRNRKYLWLLYIKVAWFYIWTLGISKLNLIIFQKWKFFLFYLNRNNSVSLKLQQLSCLLNTLIHGHFFHCTPISCMHFTSQCHRTWFKPFYWFIWQ